MNAEEIVKKLLEAKEAYYNSDSPLMSDEEFDSLEEKLKKIDPENEYFSLVGSDDSAGKKITHSVPMLSLQKAKNADDVEKWMEKLSLPEETLFCIEPKIDGLSASCKYKNGKLVYVATRGDGEQGQDITHVAPYISDIPAKISFTKKEIEIRGELYLPKDTEFETGGRPLRNNCVGLINRKENRDDLKHVRFAAYQISGLAEITSESGKTEVLKKNGFNSVHVKVTSSAVEIKDYYNNYMENFRSEWEYETDGLVITVDDNALFDEIDGRWVVDHHHHYAIALKPPAEAKETALKEIIWQVSRQGNVVPVALFEPLIIGGARIERATLNNYENVARLALKKGDVLLVERANDVIPYVRGKSGNSDTDEKSDLLIEKCPSCGSGLIPSGVHIKCVNKSCPEIIIQQILYWVKQSGIENVAESTVRTLFTKGKIKSVSDLYALKEGDFEGIEGFAGKKIKNFIDEVRKSRTMDFREFIAKLGIPMVQKKSLARLGINNLKDFQGFSDTAYVIGKNIVDWKNDERNISFLNELTKILEINDSGDTGTKGKVCMTGKGPAERKVLVGKIREMGYEFSETVTKDLSILICEDPNGSSSKLVKARKDGIKLVSYDDFFKGVL